MKKLIDGRTEERMNEGGMKKTHQRMNRIDEQAGFIDIQLSATISRWTDERKFSIDHWGTIPEAKVILAQRAYLLLTYGLTDELTNGRTPFLTESQGHSQKKKKEIDRWTRKIERGTYRGSVGWSMNIWKLFRRWMPSSWHLNIITHL